MLSASLHRAVHRAASILSLVASLTACGSARSTAAPGDGGAPDAGPLDGGRPDDGGIGGDGGPLDPACDDLDPCTVDRSVAGACVHDAAPDGTPCDDGSLCTLADRCTAGSCGGAAVTGPAETLGAQATFGTIRGLALALADDRVLFVDPPGLVATLTLAQVEGETVSVLDTLVLDDAGFYDGTDLLVHALGDGLVALVDGFGRTVHLVEVRADDRLVRRGTTAYDPAGPQPRALASTDGHLWVCANDFFSGTGQLVGVDVRDPGAPAVLGTLVLGERCHDLARAGDGTRLYVAMADATRPVDVAAFPPVLEGPIDVAVRAIDVVGDRRLVVEAGGGAFRVHRERDGAELARVAEVVNGAALTGLGVVVLRDRAAAGGTESVLRHHRVDAAGGATLLVERVVQRVPYPVGSEWWDLPAHDALVVHPWTKRPFRLSADAPHAVEARSGALGIAQTLRAEGAALFARSRYSALRFDLSDPAAPRPVAGGAHGGDPLLALELPPGRPGLLIDDVHRLYDDATVVPLRAAAGGVVDLVVRSFDGAERPVETASATLPGGPALLQLAGPHLYHVALAPGAGATAFRLRRYRVAALASGAATADLDVTLAPQGSLPAGVTAQLRFGADAKANAAAVALVGFAPSGSTTLVAWIDLGAATPAVVAETALDTYASTLRLAAGRVALAGTELVVLERDGSALDLVSRHGPLRTLATTLLAFDGRTAYVAYGGRGVDAFDAEDPAASNASYDTRGETRSLAETDVGLALGAEGGVSVVRPFCPPAP